MSLLSKCFVVKCIGKELLAETQQKTLKAQDHCGHPECIPTVSSFWRESRGICNKLSQFRCVYMGPVVHMQYYTTTHRHLKSAQLLLTAHQPCWGSRATDKSPFPFALGQSLPREPPGRDELSGSSRADMFWCQVKSLQIQLEQLREVTALFFCFLLKRAKWAGWAHPVCGSKASVTTWVYLVLSSFLNHSSWI